MSDSSLTAFVLVARTRSFTEAARQLGLSASALGKTIARLESRFGVRLFNRSTRSVALTAEGALLLERAQRILAEYEAARAELSQTAATPNGRLRVSLPLVGVVDEDLLAAFAAAYPQIVLDLDFSDRLVDVIQEGFDVVVRTGEAGDSGLSTRTLTSFRHAVVASRDYLAAHGAPQTPADLADRDCLLYRFPSTGQVETWPLEGAPRLSDGRRNIQFHSRAHRPRARRPRPGVSAGLLGSVGHRRGRACGGAKRAPGPASRLSPALAVGSPRAPESARLHRFRDG